MPFDFRKEALKHIERLEAYAKKIEQAYENANRELSRIAMSVNHPVDELFKLKDYPEIKAQVDKVMKDLHDSIEVVILNGNKLEWGYANKVNDKLAEVATGLASGEAVKSAKYKRFFNQNTSALAAFQKRKENGLNLSQRVWNLTDQYRRDMELGLSVGISDGRSAAQLSRDLRSYLNEPNKLFRRVRDEYGNLVLSKNAAAYHPGQGVYRSSYKNAMRLTRTEINMAYRAADQERWKQMDFVLGYKIARSNNPYPCPVCETLQGNYPKDFEWGGWHPQCRCVRTPILQKIDGFIADEDSVFDGGEPTGTRKGTIKDVPDNFKKWVSENRDRIQTANNQPYFIRDNQDYVRRSYDFLVGKPLTEKEKTGILKYTESAYRSINHTLRRNATLTDPDSVLVSDINSGLSKIESYQGLCYRGTGLTEKMFDRYLDAYKNNGFVIERAFISTSLDETFVKANFVDNAFYKITSKGGKPIQSYSTYKDEKEILFRNNARFKVVKATVSKKGTYYIELEEI